MNVFENVQVKTRYLSAPLDWYSRAHTFAERNLKYIDDACELGASALQKCLPSRAGFSTENLKHFIFVSSTGLATPTIDARLMNRVAIPKDVKRTPVWGLGCLGGVAGLSRAYDFVRAEGSGNALLLTVELCSLTFQTEDLSKSNLIAAALFGDGAAAALVGYDDAEDGEKIAAPEILGSAAVLWPHSLDVMGWDIVDTGLHVIFSKAIPEIVRDWLKETVEKFLSSFNLEPSDIAHYIAHPGGAKVLDAFKDSLQLQERQLKVPRKVLRDYGNTSSCSVLFVLDELLKSGAARPGDFGLISALGPGFSAELMLIRW